MPNYKPGVEELINLYGYKLPLSDVKEGYGYDGVQEMTKDGIKVLCKVCGDFYDGVSHHVKRAHGITAKEYKDRFHLMYKTALIGDRLREVRIKIAQGNKNGKANLNCRGSKKGVHHNERRYILEARNKKDLCPDQLLARIKRVQVKIGRVPTMKEFYQDGDGVKRSVIEYAFGSWTQALKILAMKPQNAPRSTREELIEYLNNFVRIHKRIPSASDSRRGLFPSLEEYRRVFGHRRMRDLAAQLIGYGP